MRLPCTFFLAIAFSLFASGCDSDGAEEPLPESIRMLDSGEFSTTVQGNQSVKGYLTGDAYYGVTEEGGEAHFEFLFVNSPDAAHVLTLAYQNEARPNGERSYQIGSAFRDSIAMDKDIFTARYRSGSKQYLSQSGSIYLLEQNRGEEISGQFNFAAKGRRDSSAAFPIGSFRAVPADDFDQLVEQHLGN